MNRQRKVLITTTYNEMGIIIDTKAEEVAQPDLQSTCNQLATDCISRQVAIDALKRLQKDISGDYTELDPMVMAGCGYIGDCIGELECLPSAQPDVPDINVGDVNKFIDELEEIFAGQRERHVDDSVCGLCEYDGAYIGQSGDWCNECPGFDRDDCFKLSDKYRKEWIDTIANSLPSAQSEIIRCKDCKHRTFHDNRISSEQCYVCDYWDFDDPQPSGFCNFAERREG